jgi:LAO/AO transport system kinase
VLEIADIFCVNKSDKDGANETARDVRGMLELGHGRDPEWEVPIVLTSATGDEGIDDLWAAIRAHEEHLRTGDRLAQRRRERFGAEIREIVGERLKAALEEAAGADVLSALTDEVLDRKIDPYTAAGRLLEKFGLPNADR